MTTNYSGWRVNRDELLSQLSARGIRPVHAVLVAHHVTFRYPDVDTAPDLALMEVVGHAFNDRIDCIVVSVIFAGTTEPRTLRADGSAYHCTLSHSIDARPVESNGLLRAGWNAVDPFPLHAVPF